MNKKVNIILLLIFSLAFIWLLWRIIRPHIEYMLKRCSTIGMVSAVDGAFAAELKRGDSAIHQILGDISKGLTLNLEQYDAVIGELLAKGHNLDHRKLDNDEPFFDPWGNRLEIWCRKLSNGKYMSRVTSKGRDGALGTADDIAVGDEIDSLE